MTDDHPRRFQVSWILLCFCIVLAFGGVSYTVYDIRRTDHAEERELAREAGRERIVLCHANNDTNKAIRDVLSLARGNPIEEVDCRPPVAAEDRFYCRALELLSPIDCGT